MRCLIVKDGIVVNIVEYSDQKPPLFTEAGEAVIPDPLALVNSAGGAYLGKLPRTIEERIMAIEKKLGL